MSEENKKQNPELNDKALEGVSGGAGLLPSACNARAHELCHDCPRRIFHICSKQESDLANYMREHGLIDDEQACPFYN